MAAADAIIFREGPVSVPLDYQVPNSAELIALAISATFDDPTSAGPYQPALEILTPDGKVLGPYALSDTIAAGASARVSWFPHVGQAAAAVAAFATETLFCATWDVPAQTSQVLAAGQEYTITVQGDYSIWTVPLNVGTPDANALYPSSSGTPRTSTQVGLDPDTLYAYPSSNPHTIGHSEVFQIDLGSGYQHVEPIGGPFSTPQSGHLYTYQVVGQGQIAKFRVNDPNRLDNYGSLKVTVGLPGAVGLVVSDGSTNVLGLTELDFVSGASVVDAGGGIAKVTVAGGGGGITTITSSGSTITVTSPTGPTTNLDLPASGVSAGTYGDATHVAVVTVNSKGIVTGASTAAISSGPGSGSTVNSYGAGSATWTKPAGCNVVQVICVGSGGGGGGGLSGTGAANLSGGGGGGGGAVSVSTFRAADLPGSVTVTVAAGGTGGTHDNPGNNGAASTFGTYAQAGGGGFGAKGVSAAPSSGGAGGAIGNSANGAVQAAPVGGVNTSAGGQSAPAAGNVDGRGSEYGGASGGGGASGTNQHNGGSSLYGGPGGGTGGGTGTTTGTAGGTGGSTNNYNAGGGGAAGSGGASTTAGVNGTFTGPYCGTGGGGGGSGNTGVTGGNGGNGSVGAGGGGGGSCANGTAGAGGNGGDGLVIVIAW